MEDTSINRVVELNARDAMDNEISLRSLLFYIIKKWRTILALALAVMLIGAVYAAITNVNQYSKAKSNAMQVIDSEKAETMIVIEYTVRDVIVDSVKTMIISFIAGILVAFLWLGLRYIFSDKILDADKMQRFSLLGSLGFIPKANAKPLKGLDKVIGAIGGIKRKREDYDTIVKLTALSIAATVSAQDIHDGDIALVGSISMEELAEISDAFNQAVSDMDIQYAVAGNPMRDVASVDAITAAKAVVIVEKQEASMLGDVVDEYSRIVAWGKSVLGAVLLNADAV